MQANITFTHLKFSIAHAKGSRERSVCETSKKKTPQQHQIILHSIKQSNYNLE